MLPKRQRINKENFKKFFSVSHLFQSRCFSVRFVSKQKEQTKNVKSPSTPSFAVIVSKRVSNRAIDRNKIRRVFYEILRSVIKKQKMNNTFFFFLPKKNIVNQRFSDLKTEIENFFEETKKG